MTPYSAAADGSFSRRASSRSTALRTSSGRFFSSTCWRSSLISACCSSPSPSSSWIAFSCWRRKNSRWPFSISDWTCDWIFEPSSTTSSSRFRIARIARRRASTLASSRRACLSSVLILSVEATRCESALGSSTFAAASSSSAGRYGTSEINRLNSFWTLRVSASSSGLSSTTSGTSLNSPTRYGSSWTRRSSTIRPTPWTRIRRLPSGTRIILCTTAAVPTSCRSSQPGCSASEPSRTVTSASIRSPATTSSTSLTERSCPIASGETDCGKTTVSFSGRTGSTDGISTSPCSSCSSMVRSLTGYRSDRDRHALALAGPGCDRQLHRQQAALVARGCRRGVDGLGERDPPLEGAVLELHLLVAAAQLRPAALACDDQHAVGRDDLDRARVDARELDQDVERRRVFAANAVDIGPEAAAGDDEARNGPEVVHELVDLVVQPVDVVSFSHLWGQRYRAVYSFPQALA